MTPVVQHGLLVDTAAGMTYLYNNGVEHRDLKSANCLVTHDWRVKVRFIARALSAALSGHRVSFFSLGKPTLAYRLKRIGVSVYLCIVHFF